MNGSFIRFDQLAPGHFMGSAVDHVTPDLLACWQRIYRWSTEPPALSPALATVLTMRAYLKVVAPRPPGNIHIGQRLRLCSAQRFVDSVTTEVWCESREIRRERRHVTFRTITTSSNRTRILFEGAIRLVWAA